MKKLIELLNEREKIVNWVQYPWWCKEDLEYQCHWPRVINKRFWFIKWLVDNNKIDLLQLDNRIALSEFNKYERVLMALSIQDSPIDFLVSILNKW